MVNRIDLTKRKDIANIELILDTAEINHKKKARKQPSHIINIGLF